MNDTVTLLASLVTIVVGIATFVKQNPFDFDIDLRPRSFHVGVKLKSTFKTFLTIVILVVIVLGLLLGFSWHISNAQSSGIQDRFNQTINTTPMASYSFDAPDSSWDVGNPSFPNDPNLGGCSFEGGGYQILMSKIDKPAFYPCYLKNLRFQNFLCQVQMQIIKGDSGGIIFRSDYSYARFYYLYVASNGTYVLDYYSTNNNGTAIMRGIYRNFHLNDMNQIAVLAIGSDFYLFNNGMYIDHVHNTLLNNGQIALTAGSTNTDAKVIYKQMQIWSF